MHREAVFIGYAVFEGDVHAANPAAGRDVFLEHWGNPLSLRIHPDVGKLRDTLLSRSTDEDIRKV